jgi:hypothetical protein
MTELGVLGSILLLARPVRPDITIACAIVRGARRRTWAFYRCGGP